MKIAAPAVLLGVALVVGNLAAVASEPRMRITYRAPLISIDASGVTVAEVLREVGRAVGFSTVEAGSSDTRLSFSIHDALLPEALQQLLRSENHVLLYRGSTQTIDAVMVLGARVAGARRPFNQPEQSPDHLDDQDQGRMNPSAEITRSSVTPVSSMSPSTPADLAAYRLWAEESPEVVNTTDLLLRHARSGVAAFPTTPASQSGPVAASSAIATDAGAADPGMTLTTTTRLAQENLAKLVQALSAANSSMFSSQRR